MAASFFPITADYCLKLRPVKGQSVIDVDNIYVKFDLRTVEEIDSDPDMEDDPRAVKLSGVCEDCLACKKNECSTDVTKKCVCAPWDVVYHPILGEKIETYPRSCRKYLSRPTVFHPEMYRQDPLEPVPDSQDLQKEIARLQARNIWLERQRDSLDQQRDNLKVAYDRLRGKNDKGKGKPNSHFQVVASPAEALVMGVDCGACLESFRVDRKQRTKECPHCDRLNALTYHRCDPDKHCDCQFNIRTQAEINRNEEVIVLLLSIWLRERCRHITFTLNFRLGLENKR